MARGSGANSSDQAILIRAGLWGRYWRDTELKDLIRCSSVLLLSLNTASSILLNTEPVTVLETNCIISVR